MDDVGLRLAQAREGGARFGRGLVRAMPIVLSVLSKIGIAAMLWVGGHILLVGLDELGSTPSTTWSTISRRTSTTRSARSAASALADQHGRLRDPRPDRRGDIVAVMHRRGRDHAQEA